MFRCCCCCSRLRLSGRLFFIQFFNGSVSIYKNQWKRFKWFSWLLIFAAEWLLFTEREIDCGGNITRNIYANVSAHDDRLFVGGCSDRATHAIELISPSFPGWFDLHVNSFRVDYLRWFKAEHFYFFLYSFIGHCLRSLGLSHGDGSSKSVNIRDVNSKFGKNKNKCEWYR